MTNPTGDAESLEAEFVKQFGPMEIHTGYGRDIEIYKLDQQEKLAAFKVGAAFITRSMQPELGRLVADKERLDWLQNRSLGFLNQAFIGTDLRKAIDAAITGDEAYSALMKGETHL